MKRVEDKELSCGDLVPLSFKERGKYQKKKVSELNFRTYGKVIRDFNEEI